MIRSDGNMHADVRMTLRTTDGALLHLAYQGRWIIPPAARAAVADPAQRNTLDPGGYYFWTAPFFETGAKRYAWLNDIVCLGSGYPIKGGVGYRIFEAG